MYSLDLGRILLFRIVNIRALMLFLCSILYLMCSGSSLHVECILPFEMLCL